MDQKLLEAIQISINLKGSRATMENILMKGGHTKQEIDEAYNYLQANPIQIAPEKMAEVVETKDKIMTQFYDSNKGALTWLLVAIVSLFIIPYMAFGAASMSGIGIYYAIKNKSGWKRISLYILTILISLLSVVLKGISKP